jgi:hypothetical protein
MTDLDSALVGYRQALPALGASPLQNDSAVLGRHPDSEAVGLLPPAVIRLIGSLTLHVLSCFDIDAGPIFVQTGRSEAVE